jgi:predicted metal-binding protein
MNTMIKKVADNIYHSIVDETDVAGFCGQDLLDFIKNNQVSNHSALILETRSKRCDMTCDRAFLRACSHFDDIAYVVKEETATYNPWKHAMLIRNSNKNTHYFDSYEDAFKWLTLHNNKHEIKVPLDFTGTVRKSNW